MKRGFLQNKNGRTASSESHQVVQKPIKPTASPPSRATDQDVVIAKIRHSSSSPTTFFPTLEYHPSSTRSYPQNVLCTRIPTNDPHGVTQCLIPGHLKSRILSLPGFPSAPPRADAGIYRIGPTESKGLGMFATRAIEMGELIVSERPLLLIPEASAFDVADICDSSTGNYDHLKAVLDRTVMELVVSRMSMDNEFAFRDLANSHIDDLGEGADGIPRTNVMDVSIGDLDAKFKMVTKTISRVNHSCRPNMLYIFDLPTFSLHLHAVRPIASGEELTISYVPPLTTSSERASLLQSRYAIPPCTLPCCTSSITDTFRTPLQTKSTDLRNRLTTLQTRIKRTVQTVLVTGSKNPNTPDELANIRKVYKNAQALIREMKKYGLEACEEYARVVYTAAWCIFALSLDPRDGLRMTDAKVKKFRVWAVGVLRVHFGEEGEIYKSLVDQNRMFGIV